MRVNLGQMELLADEAANVRCGIVGMTLEPSDTKLRNAPRLADAVEVWTPSAEEPAGGSLRDPKSVASVTATWAHFRRANRASSILRRYFRRPAGITLPGLVF